MKIPFRGTPAASVLAVMVALVVVTPWHGNDLPSWAAVVIGLVAAMVAGPREKAWWPWLVVVPAWIGLMIPSPLPLSDEAATARFDRRCQTILSLAQTVAGDPRIGDLVMGTGATLDPSQPFDLLARVAAGEPALTIYLADDRGRLVAWGGRPHGFPLGLR
ncbi:MAG: hypothetical protein ABFS37_13900, partial [Acidobacteriota bacterium]